MVSDKKSSENGKASSNDGRSSGTLATFTTFSFTAFSCVSFTRWASLTGSILVEESSVFGIAWVHTISGSALASWLGTLLEVSDGSRTTFAWCAWVARLVVASTGLLVLGLIFGTGGSWAFTLAFITVLHKWGVAIDSAPGGLTDGNHHKKLGDSLHHRNK